MLMKPNKLQDELNKMKKSNKMVKKDMWLKRWSNLRGSYSCNTERISFFELEDLQSDLLITMLKVYLHL
jgi:hypothetical protein